MSNLNCQNLTGSIRNLSKLKENFDDKIGQNRLKLPQAYEIKKQVAGEIKLRTPEIAKNIFGQDFLGPEEIKTAFIGKVEIEEIPPIPFSIAELKRAKELGQFLILRLPLTMKQIHEKLGGKLKDGIMLLYPSDKEMGQIRDDAWYKKEDFFKKEIPQAGWALVSKEVLGYRDGNPDKNATKVSASKNYLEQTHALIDYLQNEVFRDMPMPRAYTEAITEFNDFMEANPEFADQIVSQDESVWKPAAIQLTSFKINQLTRQSPAEALYDIAVYYQINNDRLFEIIYTWTKRHGSDGGLVSIGDLDAHGTDVGSDLPGSRIGNLGVAFARTR